MVYDIIWWIILHKLNKNVNNWLLLNIFLSIKFTKLNPLNVQLKFSLFTCNIRNNSGAIMRCKWNI